MLERVVEGEREGGRVRGERSEALARCPPLPVSPSTPLTCSSALRLTVAYSPFLTGGIIPSKLSSILPLNNTDGPADPPLLAAMLANLATL